MNQYRVTLLVPHQAVIEAATLKDAGDRAKALLTNKQINGDELQSVVHSVKPIGATRPVDFDLSPYPEDPGPYAA